MTLSTSSLEVCEFVDCELVVCELLSVFTNCLKPKPFSWLKLCFFAFLLKTAA